MAMEIERKFLVKKDVWENWEKEPPHYLRQGYLFKDLVKTARVRVSDDTGYMTVKGKTIGISRAEYEFEIPKQDAEDLLSAFCDTVVTKQRYIVPFEGKIWEVDVFLEQNEGLLVAEIELTEETETFTLPPFIDVEVTGDKKYYNSQLAVKPYKEW
ncbi:CYTH domain-containing protein [Flaviaesturariibacter flavus]|uniref:CYTH domain-containing protein n=1 Tax=Flaviaesturariibacter flavus TaxID=2502780 RepID=A0A4R1BNZ7_9BACT|nr:CYTH domain-containing protein [Flaviaesturariibacter flavus]TCJ19294.1 CYTH domain-containing protein [Flaviaesturariibacter flavus]